MGVKLRVLGPLEAERDGRALALGGPRQRALLAALVLGANEPVSVDRLREALGAGESPASARGRLQVSITRLRAALAITQADALLTHEPAGYRLRLGPSDLDAWAFERECREAEAALESNRPEAAADLLEHAL